MNISISADPSYKLHQQKRPHHDEPPLDSAPPTIVGQLLLVGLLICYIQIVNPQNLNLQYILLFTTIY